MTTPFAIRPPKDRTEWNLIRRTWHDGVISHTPKRSKEAMMEPLRIMITNLLEGASVLVAEAPESKGAIVMGYVVGHVGKPHLLHYWYVKTAYRGMGVGKALLDRMTGRETRSGQVVITYSPTQAFLEKATSRGWGMAFLHPITVMGEKDDGHSEVERVRRRPRPGAGGDAAGVRGGSRGVGRQGADRRKKSARRGPQGRDVRSQS